MKVKILRRKDQASEPYWESFDYTGPEDNTIAGLLDFLNYHDDIVNDADRRTTRIGWECSCMQGVCGACAMVINGVPGLACATFLRDLKKKSITLEPLRKFPVVHDLIVDRASIHEHLMQMNLFIGEYHPAPKEHHDQQYDTAKCLKCGLCLEVCPNYVGGQTFFGAVFANDCYLVAARNREKGGQVQEEYARHFGNTCSKALSCMDVCPAGISTLTSIARLNRLPAGKEHDAPSR